VIILGAKIDKAKDAIEPLKKPRITPLSFVIAIISIFSFAFMQTSLFMSLPDIFKVVIYISFTILILLTGNTSGKQINELLSQLRLILQDPKTSIEQKLNGVLNVVILGCTIAGSLFDNLNEIQFKQEG
jgi:hypothetical protein